MTQVKGSYTPQLTACTHTGDTNFSRGDTDVLPRISGGDLLANTKYLIVARGVLGGDHTNTVFTLRVTTADDSLIAAKSEQKIEPFGTTRSYPYFFVHEFDTDGTPADIDMEMATADGAQIVSVDQCSLRTIDLDDLGASNWTSTIHADASGEYPTTQADEWTIPGSTLGTDEWLILACQRTQIGATNRNYRVEAFAAEDTSTSAAVARDGNEGEDNTELRLSGFQIRHKASSGTPNFSIQTWELDTNTNALDRGGYGIAIKFSAFEDIEWDYEAGTTVIDSTERTMATITYSPTTTADHLLFGQITMNDLGFGGEQHLHIEDDTVEMRVGDQPIGYGVKYDPNTSQPVLNLFHQDNILSSDTSTYDLRGATNNANDDLAEHRWLIIWSLELAAGAQVIAVGTLAQTDSPVTASPEKIATIGTLPSTDSLLTVDPGRAFSVGVLSGFDSLLTVQPRKVVSLGTLAESESLIPVGVSIFRNIGTLAELETLLAIQARKIANIGTFSEIDSLLAIQARKIANIGTFAEIETLLTIEVVQPGGQEIAVTTLAGVDSLIAIQARKIVNIGTLAELESLLAVTGLKTVDIGTLAELESLLAIQTLKIAIIGTLGEADSLLSIQARKIATIGTLTEIDTLIAIAAVIGGDQTIPVGVLTELDLLLNISGIKTALIGTLSEAETLLTVQARKIANIGILGELDSLIAADPVKPIITPVGSLSQSDLLRPITGIKGVPVGTMAELDALLAIAADKPIITAVGTLDEIETLLALTGAKIVTMGTLAELETLLAISGLKTADVGTMIELESLLSIAAVKPIITPVGTLAETEVLVAIAVILGTPVLFVMAVDSIGKRSIVSAIEYDPNQTATVEGEIV